MEALCTNSFRFYFMLVRHDGEDNGEASGTESVVKASENKASFVRVKSTPDTKTLYPKQRKKSWGSAKM